MRSFLLSVAATGLLLTSACSEAQPSDDTTTQSLSGDKKGKKNKKGKNEDAAAAGLRKLGEMGVRESSGLARGPRPNTLYTHPDAGNEPVLYEVSTAGKLLNSLPLSVSNVDWESLTQDNSGNLFVVDAGNNSNDRRDLAIYRVNPAQTAQVGSIRFQYADQKAFPPAKEARNFDCEASLWHQGQLYLFTKDRAQHQTSKVYTLPDQPGQYTAKLLTSLPIAGEVTDAALSPNGRTLVLLAREELFVLTGSSLAEALKATPKRVSLKGAGQTEGAVFTSDDTLIISTEQGDLYEYNL